MNTNEQSRRAVGYCRTSGELQRDNTSIPRQKEEIEAFCERNGWRFVQHYVDESKSGAKVEGRTEFQQMLRDAANERFDVVVVFDVTRFSRDGSDIIQNARFLKSQFSIDVVDTKEGFDTREHRNTLLNFVQAGVSEHERLSIMERMFGGRIRKAKEGLPWAGKPPIGRAFRETGKNQGEWFVTDNGNRFRDLLTRYADGESLTELVEEFGYSLPQVVLHNIRHGQLSAQPYVVTFDAPEIGIKDLKVPVPQIPPVITPELEKRVRERMDHNRTWNKTCLRKYRFTGFVRCAHCGAALVSGVVSGIPRYRHNAHTYVGGKSCGFYSIRCEVLESHVLGYLYSFIHDKPSFDEAVKRSLPSADDRRELERKLEDAQRDIVRVEKSISNLVDAIAKGGLRLTPSVRLKQDQLETEKAALELRKSEYEEQLAAMPRPEVVERQASLLRVYLADKLKRRDWHNLPFDDIKRFLHFLFGDNPKKAGHGIFVECTNGRWRVTLKGVVSFPHDIVDGRPLSHAFQKEADRLNREIELVYKQTIGAAGETTKDDVNLKSCSRRGRAFRGRGGGWLRRRVRR